MRRIFLSVFAAAIFVAATSAHGEEASCDLSKCMSICLSEYEAGCTGMCDRIISLCRQLTVKPERTRNARRAYGSRESVKVDAQARSPGRIN